MEYLYQETKNLLKQPFQLSFYPPSLNDSILLNQDIFELSDTSNSEVSLLQVCMLVFNFHLEDKYLTIEQSIYYYASLNQDKNIISIQITDSHFLPLDTLFTYVPSTAIVLNNGVEIDVISQVCDHTNEYLKILELAKEQLKNHLNKISSIKAFKQILVNLKEISSN